MMAVRFYDTLHRWGRLLAAWAHLKSLAARKRARS